VTWGLVIGIAIYLFLAYGWFKSPVMTTDRTPWERTYVSQPEGGISERRCSASSCSPVQC
jgi:hypothetical protein